MPSLIWMKPFQRINKNGKNLTCKVDPWISRRQMLCGMGIGWDQLPSIFLKGRVSRNQDIQKALILLREPKMLFFSLHPVEFLNSSFSKTSQSSKRITERWYRMSLSRASVLPSSIQSRNSLAPPTLLQNMGIPRWNFLSCFPIFPNSRTKPP